MSDEVVKARTMLNSVTADSALHGLLTNGNQSVNNVAPSLINYICPLGRLDENVVIDKA